MKKSLKTILTLLIATCCVGCSMLGRNGGNLSDIDDSRPKSKNQSVISTGSEQLALIYNPYSTSIHPKVFVKKTNLSNIDLYVMINDAELLYSKANAQQSNMASIRIFYRIMESYENTTLVDSSSQMLTINKGASPRMYSIKLKVKDVELDKFVLQTTVTDLTRGKMSMHFCEVDKTNPYSADNFMVTDIRDMQPYPYSYIEAGAGIRVDYLNGNMDDKTITGTRQLEPQITLSPYASDPAVEDTSHYYNISEIGRSHILNVKGPGLYATTADTNWATNLVMPCFGSDYPNINTPDDMIKPLAFLCTADEYSQLSASKTKKLAVDEFWYQNSRDLKKAKEQIRIYYTRAIYANMYFSDYREGCLTDRGMLYTVLGPPKILAITSDGEVWTYRDSRNGQLVKFTFRKQKSRLCNAKYVLRRSTEYKPYWDKAVSTWRKGNVYTF